MAKNPESELAAFDLPCGGGPGRVRALPVDSGMLFILRALEDGAARRDPSHPESDVAADGLCQPLGPLRCDERPDRSAGGDGLAL